MLTFKFINMDKKKQPQPIDIYNYTTTGNLAVDMCVRCIQESRIRNQPLKAIVLSKAYYDIFRQWVARNWGEEYIEKEWAIDTVEIRKETIISGRSFIPEYYKTNEIKGA